MIPIKDRLVIKRFILPTKSKSGIIINTAESKDEPPNMGLVKHVGPEVKSIPVGSIVAVGTKWFTEFTLAKEKYVVVNEPDIIGILDDKDFDALETHYDMTEIYTALGVTRG